MNRRGFSRPQCGCRTHYEEICFCPLHAAAGELLAALRRMLAAHDADVAAGSLIAAGNSQAADQARRAISKAEAIA